MNEWMNEWMNELMNEWIGECRNTKMNFRRNLAWATEGLTDRLIDVPKMNTHIPHVTKIKRLLFSSPTYFCQKKSSWPLYERVTWAGVLTQMILVIRQKDIDAETDANGTSKLFVSREHTITVERIQGLPSWSTLFPPTMRMVVNYHPHVYGKRLLTPIIANRSDI